MAGQGNPSPLASSATLFDNSLLSDVKIKQTHKGKTREYHGHKQILSARSKFFLKAFTGNFQEAKSNVIELHDDDPDHFAIALEFIYCERDFANILGDIVKEKDHTKRALIMIGLHDVADKYVISNLEESAASELKRSLLATQEGDYGALTSSIDEYYGSCVEADQPLGKILAEVVLNVKRGRMRQPVFEELLKRNEFFAADIALSHAREGMFLCKKVKCSACTKYTVIDMTDYLSFYSGFLMSCMHCSRRTSHISLRG